MDDDAYYRDAVRRATRLGTFGAALPVAVLLVVLCAVSLFDLTRGQAVLLGVTCLTVLSAALVAYAIRTATRRRRQWEAMRRAAGGGQ